MTRANEAATVRAPPWWRTWKGLGLVGAAIVALLLGIAVEEAGKQPLTPYSAFLDQLEAGNVASVTFEGTEVKGRFKHPLIEARRDSFSSRVPEIGDPTLIAELRKQHVQIEVAAPSLWVSLLERMPWPMLLFFAAALVAGLIRVMRGGNRQSESGGSVPAQGMMGLLSGLFAKLQGASTRAKDSDESNNQ